MCDTPGVIFTSDDRELLRRIERQQQRLLRELRHVLRILIHHSATTHIDSIAGEIDMAQTTLKSLPGTDTLTFNTLDSSTPPQDITSRCTYSVTSDGPAVAVASVTGNSAAVSYTPGSANLTIATSDSGRDKIPDVVLACTIATPAVGATTVTASNSATSVS